MSDFNVSKDVTSLTTPENELQEDVLSKMTVNTVNTTNIIVRSRSCISAGANKRMPKIKVCQKNPEFSVLTAIMNKLN